MSTAQNSTSTTVDSQSGNKSGMKVLEQALTSGDIAQARQTFAALQQAVQDAWIESGEQPALSHPVIQDFDSMADSLNADDLTGALWAFAQLKVQLEAIVQAQAKAGAVPAEKSRSKGVRAA